jgi:hypothetical protein
MFYKIMATIALICAIYSSMMLAAGHNDFILWLSAAACWIAAIVLFLWRD